MAADRYGVNDVRYFFFHRLLSHNSDWKSVFIVILASFAATFAGVGRNEVVMYHQLFAETSARAGSVNQLMIAAGGCL